MHFQKPLPNQGTSNFQSEFCRCFVMDSVVQHKFCCIDSILRRWRTWKMSWITLTYFGCQRKEINQHILFVALNYLFVDQFIIHNIIHIHNNVPWDWQYSIEYSYNSTKLCEYSVEYCHSYITLLWIWIMLCIQAKTIEGLSVRWRELASRLRLWWNVAYMCTAANLDVMNYCAINQSLFKGRPLSLNVCVNIY
jgi:hypothetical protein